MIAPRTNMEASEAWIAIIRNNSHRFSKAVHDHIMIAGNVLQHWTELPCYQRSRHRDFGLRNSSNIEEGNSQSSIHIDSLAFSSALDTAHIYPHPSTNHLISLFSLGAAKLSKRFSESWAPWKHCPSTWVWACTLSSAMTNWPLISFLISDLIWCTVLWNLSKIDFFSPGWGSSWYPCAGVWNSIIVNAKLIIKMSSPGKAPGKGTTTQVRKPENTHRFRSSTPAVKAIMHFAQYAAMSSTSTAAALVAVVDSISQMVVFRISSHIYLRVVFRSCSLHTNIYIRQVK